MKSLHQKWQNQLLLVKIKKGHKKTIYIIEISSFQLEIKSDLKPEIAVLLNISEDHLDRHASMTEYRDIKSNIFKIHCALKIDCILFFNVNVE